MNRRNLFCLSTILSVVFAVTVLAEVPNFINYQGILLDSGDQPVTTPVNVIFAIWDDPAAGDSLWSEQQTITPGTDGSFSTLLGSVSEISDVVFAGTDAYLSIKVEADPEMTPRRRIVSAGYAHRISTVDGASGGTVHGDISISAGDLILENSTGAAGNIIKGGFRFIHDFGAFNTFVGSQAGNFNMSGNTNTASGYAVLNNNTTGSSNTGTGASALNSNLGGSNNTANGAFALQYNNTGHDNTALGHFALRNNTLGHNNTASGAWALAGNTEGFENTANGYEALYSNTTGKGNTASGYLALRGNTLGLYNAADGYQALTSNTEGSYNTASGYQSLSQNIDGIKNTAYGSHTLRFNTTGHLQYCQRVLCT